MKDHLAAHHQQALLHALNACPLLNEKLTLVDSQANLHHASGTIHWQNVLAERE